MERVANMPELLFMENFRLNKSIFRQLCNDLRVHTSLRGSREIPLEIKVLTALSFATGSYQRIVGVSQQLSQRTTSRCIWQVVDALNHPSLMNKWIKFPQTIQESFQRKYDLPGVIGCIDCTHIAIVKPAEEERAFYNRKGYHSLNVQMVCDHNLKILNVNCKFSGATHDSHIWLSSLVEPYMRHLHGRGEHVWLLGDSGYPQRPWPMTPILNAPQGSREELYTTSHVQAKTCIERCFGLLKTRWRCLLRDRALHYHPTVASKITIACCVLHNISLHAHLPAPSYIPAAVDDNDDSSTQISSTSTESQSELIRGRAMLNYLISWL